MHRSTEFRTVGSRAVDLRRDGSRPTMARLFLGTVLLVITVLPGGCATTVGTIAGPITGPLTAWRHTQGMPTWAKPVVWPLAVLLGPVLGFIEGARCDAGWLRNGAYGVDGSPPFELVFDPSSVRLSASPRSEERR